MATSTFIAYQIPWFKYDIPGLGTVLEYQVSGSFHGTPLALSAASSDADSFAFFWIVSVPLILAAIGCAVADHGWERGLIMTGTGIATLVLTAGAYLFKGQITGLAGDRLGSDASMGPDTGFWLMLGLSAAMIVYGLIKAGSDEATSADAQENHA